MNQTWWVDEDELDDDQKGVIALPLEGSFLVTGPPGSGKTNLLVLRARYLTLAGKSNIALLVFTRALREFIALGSERYSLRPERVSTHLSWEYKLLRRLGGDLSGLPEDNLMQAREELLRRVRVAIREQGVKHRHYAILIDESQDYLPEEIDLFFDMAQYVYAVADPRQKIYEGPDAVAAIRRHSPQCRHLRFHYRNGRKICSVADELGKLTIGHEPMIRTSQYDEVRRPSSVTVVEAPSIDEQVQKLLESLRLQRKAYPDELLGVLCPKNRIVDVVYRAVAETELTQSAAFQSRSLGHVTLNDATRIIGMTVHSAKGLEFRCVHIIGADETDKLFNPVNLEYTAVTRTKTALSIYHTGPLSPGLDGALAAASPQRRLPSLGDILRGKK